MFSALHIMAAEYKSILYKPADENSSTFTICNKNGDDQTCYFPWDTEMWFSLLLLGFFLS